MILERWLGFGTFFPVTALSEKQLFFWRFWGRFSACCSWSLIGINLQRSSISDVFMRSWSLILAPEKMKSPLEKPGECWSHFRVGSVVFQPAAREIIEIIPCPWCSQWGRSRTWPPWTSPGGVGGPWTCPTRDLAWFGAAKGHSLCGQSYFRLQEKGITCRNENWCIHWVRGAERGGKGRLCIQTGWWISQGADRWWCCHWRALSHS